jgi:DNA-binding transcriptional ArsR family regulator
LRRIFENIGSSRCRPKSSATLSNWPRWVVQGDKAGTAAGEIQAHVDKPASTLSHHLKRLLDAGLL